MVKYFTWNQNTFSCIKGVVDYGVAFLYEFRHACNGLAKRVLFCDAIRNCVGVIKKAIRNGIPSFFIKGLIKAIFFYLGTFVEVGFSNNIGHACLNYLKTVVFKVLFNIVVCSRMEIKQVFAHNQNLRPWMRTIKCNIFHGVD